MLDRPADVDYLDAIDDAAQDWLRVRIWTERGQVVRFTVQYETTLAGEPLPVVRYDTAHGRTHRDRMNRRGEEVEKEFTLDLSLRDAIIDAERDLRHNWRRYRRAFFEDEP